jgi:membrane peptidoglycan carboxypeptidase
VKTIEELRRALEDETTGLPMNISTERIRRRARAVRRGQVVAIAAGALAVLLTAAGIVGLPHRTSPPVLPTQVGPTTIYYRDGTTVLARFDGSDRSQLAGPVGLVVNHVLDELSHEAGSPLRGHSWESIRNGAFAITTTIDPAAQQVLEQSADLTVDGSVMYGQPANLQAAGAVVEPGTGRVLAYFGGHDGQGADYASTYVDEDGKPVGFGGHPPGGTFMAYTLAAALKAGYSLKSQWLWKPHDQVGRTGPYQIHNNSVCPSNPSGGSCSLLDSVTSTLYVPMYGVTVSVGPARVVDMARQAGIDTMRADDGTRVDLRTVDPNSVVPSRFDTVLGIGQYPVTVLDQANAMATFAAGGLRATAHFVQRVASGGRVVYSDTPPDPGQPRVLSAGALADLTYALSKTGVVPGMAVKTGNWSSTSDLSQNSHAWSIGYTSAVAAAIWVGNKADERPIHDRANATIWGSGLPTQMLRRVVTDTQTRLGLRPAAFPPPAFVGDVNPPGSTPS